MRTRRLRIETLAVDHANVVFASQLDPRIYTFIPEEPYTTVEALAERYGMLVRGAREGSGETWLNWVMFDEQTPVGTLQATVMSEEKRAFVAYVVFADHWKKGFGSEGTQWLLDHLARDHGVTTAEAYIDVRNEASRRLVQKLGFRHKETQTTPEGSDDVFMKELG